MSVDLRESFGWMRWSRRLTPPEDLGEEQRGRPLKTLGAIGAAALLFIGFNYLTSQAPEPVRNVLDSQVPVVAIADEAVDAATSDAEDRFASEAKRSEMYRLSPAQTRSEIIEMGYWLCATNPPERAAIFQAQYPQATRADIVALESLVRELELIAERVGLCG